MSEIEFAQILKGMLKAPYMTNEEIDARRKTYKLSIRKGDKFRMQGTSKEYWIKDFNCDVDTVATVLEDVKSIKQRKILVRVDKINGHIKKVLQVNLNRLIGLSIDTPINQLARI